MSSGIETDSILTVLLNNTREAHEYMWHNITAEPNWVMVRVIGAGNSLRIDLLTEELTRDEVYQHRHMRTNLAESLVEVGSWESISKQVENDS